MHFFVACKLHIQRHMLKPDFGKSHQIAANIAPELHRNCRKNLIKNCMCEGAFISQLLKTSNYNYIVFALLLFLPSAISLEVNPASIGPPKSERVNCFFNTQTSILQGWSLLHSEHFPSLYSQISRSRHACKADISC